MSEIVLNEQASASTPATGKGKLYYSSSDNKLHVVDDAGTDTALGAGGSSTDELVKVTASDTTARVLDDKLVVDSSMTKTTLNAGADEQIQLTALGDHKGMVSGGDTTPDYHENKFTAGTGISLAKQNAGANETIEISCTIAADDHQALVSSNDTTPGYLNGKLVAGTGVTLTENNDGANETLTISASLAGGAIVGEIRMWPTNTAPTNWLLCAGQLLSNTTYVDLLGVLLTDIDVENDLGLGAGTTCTADASTDTITATAHGLSNNDVVLFTNSGGALPGGLSTNTIYYVISATTDTFQVSTSSGGSAVDITSAGTGTHYFHTQFNNVDMRGRFPLGQDDMSGTGADRVTSVEADKIAGSGGEETHTLTESEIPSHHHQHQDRDGNPLYAYAAGGTNYRVNPGAADSASTTPHITANTGGGAAHNNMPPYLTLNFIIYAGV